MSAKRLLKVGEKITFGLIRRPAPSLSAARMHLTARPRAAFLPCSSTDPSKRRPASATRRSYDRDRLTEHSSRLARTVGDLSPAAHYSVSPSVRRNRAGPRSNSTGRIPLSCADRVGRSAVLILPGVRSHMLWGTRRRPGRFAVLTIVRAASAGAPNHQLQGQNHPPSCHGKLPPQNPLE